MTADSVFPGPLTAAIKARRMVRAFAPDPIPPADVDQLLDAARRGPSAGNTQAAEFLVLNTPADCERYWNTTFTPTSRQSFRWQGLFEAPVLVVVTTRPDSYPERYAEADKARQGLGDSTAEWPVPFWWVDAGAVVQNLLLLTGERGLGACLFGIFAHEASVKREFSVPDDVRLVATIALGRPRPDEPGRSASRPRPPLAEVTHYGVWSPN